MTRVAFRRFVDECPTGAGRIPASLAAYSFPLMGARSGVTSLVGRVRELDALQAAIDQTAIGRGQVVLVEGEPGIGKTRIVREACRAAAQAGFTVFAGTCDDVMAPPPFAPLIAAFGIRADGGDNRHQALVDLFDATGLPDAPRTTPNPATQYRGVEALCDLVEELAEGGPLLIALDDLQWADVPTLTTVRSIGRRRHTLPVLLICAYRAGHRFAELHRVADDLARSGATELLVGPLAHEDVVALVSDILADPPTGDLLARVAGAAGNPLFVIEYTRAVVADEAGSDPGTEAELEFRRTVLRRVGALSDAANDVLRLASVLGSVFSVSNLAIVSGRAVVDLTLTLQEVVTAGLVDERGDHLGFRHALVRDAIYQSIPIGLRRQLHREIGRLLAEAGSDALAVAHHLSLGATEDDTEAVSWLRRAARESVSRSPATAVELLERARELLGPVAEERDALLAELAVALAWSGRLAEAEHLATEVIERRPPSWIAGPLRCGLAYALTWQGRPREALRHALVDDDDDLDERDRVLLQAQAAVASLFAFDMRSAGELSAAAIAAAERLDHELALCAALTAASWSELFAGGPGSVDLARRAVLVADRSTSGEAHLAHPRFFLGGIPLLAADLLDEAEEMLRSGLRLAERLGLSWSFPLYHSFLGSRAYIAGDWDTAQAECETALAVADEVGLHVGIIAATSGWLAALQLHRGDLDGAERTIASALARLADEGPQLGLGVLNWARALVLDARGDREQALELLQAAYDLYMAGGPVGDSWSSTLLVRLLVATGQHERAMPLVPPMPDDPTAYGRANITLKLGLVTDDVDTLVEAVVLHRASRRPHELAEACEDAASHLARVGRLDEAVALWNEALEVCERLGAERDIAKVMADLRRYGVRRGARRPIARATVGWDSLTATERKVVALVAQRVSNPAVAEQLFISRHTVESHLKHIYRKLGIASRLELADLAARHAEMAG